MGRPVQEPTVTHDSLVGTKEECVTHPAFGQISVSRCQGGNTTLYGSDFVHNNYITVTITGSELHRRLNRDWHFNKGQIIQIAMSEAQWATFVSSFNMGSGTPCTIEWTKEDGLVPAIPNPTDRHEQFQREDDTKLQGVMETLKQLDDAIAASGLSGKKAEALRCYVFRAQQNLGVNLDFVSKSFSEHMEKVSEAAKVEVHGYINNVLHRAGLDALGGAAPLMLGSNDQ